MFVSRYRHKIDNANAALGIAFIAMLFSMVVSFNLMNRNSELQNAQRFFVPANLGVGTVKSPGDISPTDVYGFAVLILQQLNRWEKDGKEDYQSNIFRLQYFTTLNFRNYLENDMNVRRQKGTLAGRERTLSIISGRGYEEARVQQESAESWTVWLDVESEESIGKTKFKEVHIQYPLRVVRYDIDTEKNQWGLALDGYTQEPLLLDEKMLAEPFTRRMK